MLACFTHGLATLVASTNPRLEEAKMNFSGLHDIQLNEHFKNWQTVISEPTFLMTLYIHMVDLLRHPAENSSVQSDFGADGLPHYMPHWWIWTSEEETTAQC